MPLCSCGETIDQCEFWQDIYQDIPTSDSSEVYKKILLHAQQKYIGKDFIDASKTLKGFKRYFNDNLSKELDLQILFLIRDFRSWLLSTRKTQIRKKSKS